MLKTLATKLFGRPSPADELGKLLQYPRNKEDLLGVQELELPTPDKILSDANRIVSYGRSPEYATFAKEAWARVLSHLDVIMDDKASMEKVNFHRAALKSTLDLLRLSYQAKVTKDTLEKEQAANVTPRR